MIRKKEWEKSFKNVNGREPNEEDYEKALSLGLVREESSFPNSNKKTVLVLGTVIVSLLIFAIGILLTIFFYPSPKSSQASFASSTSQWRNFYRIINNKCRLYQILFYICLKEKA